MGNERARILQLVSEGELTIEQADQLLEALAEREAEAQAPRAPASYSDPLDGDLADTVRTARRAVRDARRVARVVRRSVGRERVRKNPAFDQLIQLAIHDVSPEYVRGLREAGLDDLTVDQVVQLGIHEITPEYIRKMRDAGIDDLVSFDEFIQLAIHEVDADYVIQLKQAGIEDLSVDSIVQMAIHGVKPEMVKEWQELGLEFGDGSDDEDDEERAADAREQLREILSVSRDALKAAGMEVLSEKLRMAAEAAAPRPPAPPTPPTPPTAPAPPAPSPKPVDPEAQ